MILDRKLSKICGNELFHFIVMVMCVVFSSWIHISSATLSKHGNRLISKSSVPFVSFALFNFMRSILNERKRVEKNSIDFLLTSFSRCTRHNHDLGTFTQAIEGRKKTRLKWKESENMEQALLITLKTKIHANTLFQSSHSADTRTVPTEITQARKMACTVVVHKHFLVRRVWHWVYNNLHTNKAPFST